MHPLTVARVQRWYRDYNRKYFGGKLPKHVKIHLTWDHEHRGWLEGKAPQFGVIHINPECGGHSGYARLTLLHEMVHLEQWPSGHHGERFQERMRALAAAGAMKGIW